LLPDYQNLYPKCTQWFRLDATAATTDQTAQHSFMN